MKRDYKLYLSDMKESIKNIEEYMKGVSQEEFNKNKQLRDAVMRNLEIMGEASRNIPRALKEKNKQVSWFDISQFRDYITHSYFNVSPLTIWKTVKEKLPQIKESLQNITLV